MRAFLRLFPLPLRRLLLWIGAAAVVFLAATIEPIATMLANTKQLLALSALWLPLINARIYPTRWPNTTWDEYNWRLETQICDQGHYQGRPALANGYIGINVAALGPFFEVDTPVNGDMINGWPLFDRRQTVATIAGFWDEQPTVNMSNYPWLYQYGGESVISGVPHWSGLMPSCKGSVLDASTPLSQISGFTSTFDYRKATLTWSYTWTPHDCPALAIDYQMFVHKLYAHQAAVRLQVTPSSDVDLTFYDVLDGDCALRTQFVDKGFDSKSASIFSAVSPHNVLNVTAYVYSTLNGDPTIDMSTLSVVSDNSFTGHNQSSIAQSVKGNLRAGKTSTIRKFIGVASSDAIANPQKVAQQASLLASQKGYINLLASHSKEWAAVMPADSVDSYRNPTTGNLIEDPYAIEQQILAITNPFYMLQNTVGQNTVAAAGNPNLNKYSISVAGLVSDSYAGMVFWDADVWMQPGLALAFPDAVKQIADYRYDRHPQAKANIGMAFSSSQKNTNFAPESAIYSWTSARYGNCTATGPCFDYEYHINGDVALQVENYWLVTGDTAGFRDTYWTVFESAASLYADLLYLNKGTGTYMMKNATDPDEFANNINNPGYTMLLAQTIMNRANQYRKQFGMAQNETWAERAKNIEIPVNKKAGLHLEYSGMNGGVVVKQADVVLIYDFLHYHSPYAADDLNFYAGRQSLDGPAMTFGVFSIVDAEIADTGCAFYTYDLYGSYPYVRAPWYQFSEQLIDDFQLNGGFHPAFPFLTGMGGANRVAPFGYLGLRLMPSSFNINPVLPPQIPNLSMRRIYWQGYAIKAVMNQTHTTVTRLDESLPSANKAYANSGIPVTIGQKKEVHMLQPHSTLTFATRNPGAKPTVAGNVAQCRSVVNSTENFLPGQFPLAAVDGGISTKWQPSLAIDSSFMTVSLGDAGMVPISSFYFDWAQAPPEAFKITFSNVSNPSPAQMRLAASSNKIAVSKPYDTKTINATLTYQSNTTTVKLAHPVMGGRYATLTIQGNQADSSKNATGASVAEWAIIAEGGHSL